MKKIEPMIKQLKQTLMKLLPLKALFQRISNEAPDSTVKNYVESYFAQLRYSAELGQARTAVIAALEPVYAALREENACGAFQSFVEKYPDLETMLEAAGIEREKAAEWRQRTAETNFDDFFAFFKKQRKRMWLLDVLLIFAAVNILVHSLYFSSIAIPRILLNAVVAALAVYFVVRYYRISLGRTGISAERFEEMEKLFDRYGRKSLNWMMLLFLVFFVFVFDLVNLGVNSRASEILERLSGNLRILAILAFFMVKNLLLIRWLIRNVEFDRSPNYKRELRRVLIFSGVYWLAALGLHFVFEYYLVKNISLLFYVGYALTMLAFNLFRLKHFCYSRWRFTKPAAALIVIAILAAGGYLYMRKNVWLTQPYINAVKNLSETKNEIAYNEETGVYTITNDDGSDFKILQLTDIHIGGSVITYDKDLKALEACFKLIEHTKPDLVIVTGDLCYPIGLQSFSFNNSAPVQQFAAFMRNTGVPWAFTYGNHDTERVAIINETGLDELFRSLSWKTSKNLLYPYVQPEIMGRSNQIIELRNQDGSLNQALFLIDSNAYTGEGLNKYDYIHDDQVDWYRENVLRLNAEEGKTVSSMCFFHIPLQQYRTAYELYEAGSEEVSYFFGANEEKLFDKICCSEYPSRMFDAAKELGSTKAFFCGHDHYNNMSLEYQGIRLTYGMSIDYFVSPGIARDTRQRGATLITCHPDSAWEIEQIPLTSLAKEENRQ